MSHQSVLLSWTMWSVDPHCMADWQILAVNSSTGLPSVALALVISSLLVLWCMKPGHYQSDLWFYMFNHWWCSLILIPAVKKTVSRPGLSVWNVLDHCLGMRWPLNGLFTCKNHWKYLFTDIYLTIFRLFLKDCVLLFMNLAIKVVISYWCGWLWT